MALHWWWGRMDGWRNWVYGIVLGKKRQWVWSGNRMVRVMSRCVARWQSVRMHDPPLLTQTSSSPWPPRNTSSILPTCRLSDWLLGLAVHHLPPAGEECHHTSRSLVTYGTKTAAKSWFSCVYEQKRDACISFHYFVQTWSKSSCKNAHSIMSTK